MDQMTGFFLFLGVVAGWMLLSNNQQRQRDRELLLPKEEEQPVAPVASVPLNVTARSVDDIIGTYKGEKICRYIQLDDGRSFVFESIAIEQSPGVYHADNLDGVYIVVDKYLLYREIPV
jgi:hypothetical protein